MTRIGSLFSGYEGLGAGIQAVIGGELAWVADPDPGASALLAHHFPAVKNLGDITSVDWDTVEPADVLAGGFPCQDTSQAGVRAGLKHGNRSGLWHEFAKAIAAQRPRLVVIENVLGLLTARGDEPTAEHLAAEASRDAAGRLLAWLENELGLAVSKRDTRRARQCRARTARVTKARKRAAARCQWHEQRLIRAIGTVLASLAALGYDAEWVVVTASAAGACHRRARIFILAFPAEGRAVRGNPVAVIEDGAWMEPGESLFGALPFTGRVPASGSMAGGYIYAAEPGPTEAGAGLLSTPQARDHKGVPGDGFNNACLVRDVSLLAAGQASRGDDLPEAVRYLPTPAARDGKGRTSKTYPRGNETLLGALLPTPSVADGTGGHKTRSGDRKGEPLLGGIAMLLPTPTANVSGRTGEQHMAMRESIGRSTPSQLEADAQLLPTPSAGNFNDGEDLASLEARRQRNLAKGINGNGQGTPLPVAAQILAAQALAAAAYPLLMTALASDTPARGINWGPYTLAIERWSAVTGRPAPPPTVPGKTGERLNPALPEWMMGLPEGWITDVPGLSRNAMLKLAGNGCVPQQVALALRLLLDRAGLAQVRDAA